MNKLREQYETETGFNWGREIDGLPFHSLGYCTWLEEKASRDSRMLSAVPSENKIVSAAIQEARKHNSECGLLPNNNDVRMFCKGANWMKEEITKLGIAG